MFVSLDSELSSNTGLLKLKYAKYHLGNLADADSVGLGGV